MASVYSKEPIDILRKTIIVVLMIGAMLLLHRFAVPDEHFDPRGLLALGFVILATYTIGELTEVIGLPHITGYLLAGVLLGPSMAYFLHDVYPHLQLPPPLDEGILSHEITEQLSPLNKLALALIALTAGGELKLKELVFEPLASPGGIACYLTRRSSRVYCSSTSEVHSRLSPSSTTGASGTPSYYRWVGTTWFRI